MILVQDTRSGFSRALQQQHEKRGGGGGGGGLRRQIGLQGSLYQNRLPDSPDV